MASCLDASARAAQYSGFLVCPLSFRSDAPVSCSDRRYLGVPIPDSRRTLPDSRFPIPEA